MFGNLKTTNNPRRFYLRRVEKVDIEFGLLAIAYNLAKVASSTTFCAPKDILKG
ncbi:transposase DDE domain protein [Bacteroides fragilis str. 3719 A10]|nr:transposase DDE domain protein [Bacteroides fragilis str. 3719 A10]EXZ86966.1 transposase DDE domain protein [Bacteroides fragilis str. J38-1]